jgi:polyprenyl-phospho-N-acetylgalactosaminyl synthase
VIVVDDGSADNTQRAVKETGARLISHLTRRGYVKSIEDAVRAAGGEIIVTMDADGQHDPAAIPKLVQPIRLGYADLVIGRRNRIPYLSEQVIGRLVNSRVRCSDVGSGFRAFRRGLVQKMRFWGFCLCGSLLLEAHRQGAKVIEVPITVSPRGFGRSHWSFS